MRRWARARGRLARFVAEIYMIDAKITRKWFAAGVDERCICVFGHQNARWYGDAFFLKAQMRFIYVQNSKEESTDR